MTSSLEDGSEPGTGPVSLISFIAIGLSGSLLLVCCAGLLIRMRMRRIHPKQWTLRGASGSRSTQTLPAAPEGRKRVELQATESENSRDEEDDERLAIDVADELDWLRKERSERAKTGGAQPLPTYSTVVGAAI